MLSYAISIKYMLAGYGVIFTVLAVYLFSLFVRWRNLKRDLHSLDEIGKKD
jgi:CcmD family protein